MATTPGTETQEGPAQAVPTRGRSGAAGPGRAGRW